MTKPSSYNKKSHFEIEEDDVDKMEVRYVTNILHIVFQLVRMDSGSKIHFMIFFIEYTV